MRNSAALIACIARRLHRCPLPDCRFFWVLQAVAAYPFVHGSFLSSAHYLLHESGLFRVLQPIPLPTHLRPHLPE